MKNGSDAGYFGSLVMKLIRGKDLTREEAHTAWRAIVANEQSELHQGAFLAALAMKGETVDEIRGSWNAIYELDTMKVDLSHLVPLVDNCGTGMDTLKTFNISTAAALIAAANGVYMAKHGARGITSQCGTVDVLEHLGVDVECPPLMVRESIATAGIGIFNGMSARIHPEALFRILSQIRFGSTLNIAGSLANPASPSLGVRGVFSPALVTHTAEVMREIGYTKAFVMYGGKEGDAKGMDELSTISTSKVAILSSDGSITTEKYAPEDFGITRARYSDVAMPESVAGAAKTLLDVLRGNAPSAQIDIVCYNAAPVLLVAEKASSFENALRLAYETVASSRAIETLRAWVRIQNRMPEQGEETLERALAA